MNQYYQEPIYDTEAPLFNMNKVDVRLSFIRKVYLILSAQLILTTGLVAVGMTNKGYREYIRTHVSLFIVAIVLNLISAYAIICSKSVARTVPTNYFFLSLFTLTEAYLVSMITSVTEPEIVFVAVCLTAGIVVSLTIYAMYTKTDFTMMGGMLFMLCSTLILMTILAIFIRTTALQIIISSFAVFLFGIYLIYDTQLIVGGKRAELSIDDYIVGALMLYIDIITIFIEILKLLSIASGNRNN